MRNGNLLKSRVSEIWVKRIRVNQGIGVSRINILLRSGIKKYFEISPGTKLFLLLYKNA